MQAKKVLFVDDDKFLLDMYALKFSKAKYEVKTADSTDVALKLLRDGCDSFLETDLSGLWIPIGKCDTRKQRRKPKA